MKILQHIANCETEKIMLDSLWSHILELERVVGLSKATKEEIKAKISSRIAQCDISIRDHKKLINEASNK